MKKILLFVFLLFSVVGFCGCGRDLNVEAEKNSATASKESKISETSSCEMPTDKDYAYAHKLAALYEMYTFGNEFGENSSVLFTMGLLREVGLAEKYTDEGIFSMSHEDVRYLSALFFDKSLISENNDWEYSYSSEADNNIILKPFTVRNEPYGINIMYGMFAEDEEKNLHWLYPVNFKFVPCKTMEEDIPQELKGKLPVEEMTFKILNVTNITQEEEYRKIYTENGYGDLLVPKSYELKTANDIQTMSQRVGTGLYNEINASYTLCNDIDMEGIDFYPIGENNLPLDIGDYRNPNRRGFNGSFDGGNHKISNLKCHISPPGGDVQLGGIGFFGVLDADSHIKDLVIENADISNEGKNNAGGTGILAGQSFCGKIENCTVSGSVKGLSDVGGFVGATHFDIKNSDYERCGIISDCSAKADVVAQNCGGVFIGVNHGNVIDNCKAMGSITVANLMSNDTGGVIGGFAGHNIAADIINSRCESLVNTNIISSCVGSFVGLNEGNVKNSVYRLDLSLWKGAGDAPRTDLITDIKGLSKEEYYK